MKIENIFAAIATGAKIFNTASTLAVIVGAVYLVDCRANAPSSESIDRCWFTALPIMGIGVAGRGGFSVGYNTLNPSLRKEEEKTGSTSRNPFHRRDG